MKEIILASGESTQVDDDDYDYLIQFSWSIGGGGYPRYTINKKSYYIHKIVVNCGALDTVDHIDGNKLNNQKSNLRKCTKLENSRNRNLDKRNKSGYKGVNWDGRDEKWRASITVNGKAKWLGLFADPIEAAMSYDLAARKYFGLFAKTNKDMGLLNK